MNYINHQANVSSSSSSLHEHIENRHFKIVPSRYVPIVTGTIRCDIIINYIMRSNQYKGIL